MGTYVNYQIGIKIGNNIFNSSVCGIKFNRSIIEEVWND